MEQRITLVTLGVEELDRSTTFFERLGWRRSVKRAQGVTLFQCGCIGLALFPLEELALNAGISPARWGFAGIALAFNTRTKEEVDAVLKEAKAAGAEIVKPGTDAFWGGYSGYFRDLDGYLWEVAWNPGFPLSEDGAVSLPD